MSNLKQSPCRWIPCCTGQSRISGCTSYISRGNTVVTDPVPGQNCCRANAFVTQDLKRVLNAGLIPPSSTASAIHTNTQLRCGNRKRAATHTLASSTLSLRPDKLHFRASSKARTSSQNVWRCKAQVKVHPQKAYQLIVTVQQSLHIHNLLLGDQSSKTSMKSR